MGGGREVPGAEKGGWTEGTRQLAKRLRECLPGVPDARREARGGKKEAEKAGH